MNQTSAVYPAEVDEFERVGLVKAPCRNVRAPRVAAAPAAIECILYQTIPLKPKSGLASATTIVIGEVVGIHIDDAILTDGLVDTTRLKPVARLGRFPLPIEVLPFAGAWVARALDELGGTPTPRRSAGGPPFRTDQGNAIFDTAFGPIEDVRSLAVRLSQIAGIVEHGLFLDEIDTVFIGRSDGVEVRRRNASS